MQQFMLYMLVHLYLNIIAYKVLLKCGSAVCATRINLHVSFSDVYSSILQLATILTSTPELSKFIHKSLMVRVICNSYVF